MNSPDPFEERLRRTPFRAAPASLRQEVLRAAQMARISPGRDANPIRAWIERWSSPRRVAWAGLGFAWLVILLLNFAALEAGPSAAPHRVQRRITPALTAALREQRAWLDYLLEEPAAPALAPRPGPGAGLGWGRRDGSSLV